MRKFIFILYIILIIFLIGCARDNKSSNDIKFYVVCGCGCCGIEPLEQCLYHSKGDDIKTIIEEDKKIRDNPQCATVGCSRGIKYYYCD